MREILVVVLKMERALRRTGVRSPMMLGARRAISGGGDEVPDVGYVLVGGVMNYVTIGI